MNTKILSAEEALPVIRDLLGKGIPCRMVVTGRSMKPFLKEKRDSVVIRPFTGKVKKGSILLYTRSSGSCVLHRVVKTGSSILMCGDAQTHTERIEISQILGEVSEICSNGKSFSADSFRWILISRLWMASRPLRPFFFKTGAKIKKILKKGTELQE